MNIEFHSQTWPEHDTAPNFKGMPLDPSRIETLFALPTGPLTGGIDLGHSREGRPITGFRFGSGDFRISLLAGCHADEPVGPRTLHHLAAYLGSLPSDDPMLKGYEWWIVPHINPDGAARNRGWEEQAGMAFELAPYLASAVREQPGDDIEFGFPTGSDDLEARPENRAVYEWWRTAPGPFSLHASLHGMGFAAGPWFLIEPAWRDRCELLKSRCREGVHELGYRLHDVEREGEKGFFRLERGFCTRPDSRHMRRHFESIGEPETAALFRPSSMETMRSLGGDPLTLVSEMPLFIIPGAGEDLGPPDPIMEDWKDSIAEWKARISDGEDPSAIESEAAESGLRPMPIRDQMLLQWTFIAAGVEQVEKTKG